MSVSLQSIITQFVSENHVIPWGHTDRFFQSMTNERYNVYSDPKSVTSIRSRYHLLQVLLMGWDALKNDMKKGNAKKPAVDSTCSDILFSVWACIPCLLDEKAQHFFHDYFTSKEDPRYAFLKTNNHNVWHLPHHTASDTSIYVETMWKQVCENPTVEIVEEVLRCAQTYLGDMTSVLNNSIPSSLQTNTQMLVDMLNEDKNNTLPLCGESFEWLVSLARGLFETQSVFMPPLSSLPSNPIKFTELAEQWNKFPPNTLSQAFVYSWENSWDIVYLHPDKLSDVLVSPGETFSSHRVNTLCSIHAHKEMLFYHMGFEGDRVWLDLAPLEESNFKFLGHDWNNLKAVAHAKDPLRVLILGGKGSGKTALMRTLAHIANKAIVSPLVRDLSWDSVAIKSAHNTACRKQAMVFLDNKRNYLLQSEGKKNQVVDDILNGSLRKDMQGPEIWSMESTEGIAPNILAHFDLIVTLPSMPLPQRILLAQKHFEESALANRVAQSCSTPGQILDLAQWQKVTGQNDWMSLSSRLAGVQRAIVESKENEGALPLSIHHPTPLSEGFSAVVGQDAIVAQAQRAIAGLKDPLRFKKLGGKVPKGILLKGGPGMGKTHLARAMAQEAGVPLLLADSAAMAQTPELISKVFAEARRQSPCLLFLDELDAIGASAENRNGASADPKRQAILNRVLMELDGFNQLDGVLVIGATHRSEVLDSALVRSGRLGLHMMLEDPTTQAREQLWRFYLKDITTGDINWKRLSKISTGMSPADIAQAANQSVMVAFANDADCVDTKHVVEAIDATLWGGSPSDLPIVADELHRVAVHEVGHALIAWRNGEEIERISVRPRSNALGYVRTLPEEGRYGFTSATVANHLALSFGGLAAETAVFGGHASGVSADLKACRQMARMAVRVDGMDEKLPAGIPKVFEAAFSPDLVRQAEEIECTLLTTMREETIKWMQAHKDIVELFAQYILQEREIDGEEAQTWLEKYSTITPVNSEGGMGLMAAAQQWNRSARL